MSQIFTFFHFLFLKFLKSYLNPHSLFLLYLVFGLNVIGGGCNAFILSPFLFVFWWIAAFTLRSSLITFYC